MVSFPPAVQLMSEPNEVILVLFKLKGGMHDGQFPFPTALSPTTPEAITDPEPS